MTSPSDNPSAPGDAPRYSVVAPCYNEEESLPEFLRRTVAACGQVEGSWEIVLVDDGSSDRTWQFITDCAAEDPRVVGVKLSRNHGHQLALSAGLTICRGERVLIIDADLQDPPEALPEMDRLMDAENADVVYGQRGKRAGETIFKRASAAGFYRLINRLSDTSIPVDTGDFRLISRRALDVLMSMPERHRFVRGMVSWIGFTQVPYRYDRDSRYAGDTKYPLRKMLDLAINAVTSFSTKPLRLATWFALFACLFGLVLLLYAIISKLFWEVETGWTSLLGAVAMLGGMQLFVIAVLGIYVGRIHDQVKQRPLFIIEEIRRG